MRIWVILAVCLALAAVALGAQPDLSVNNGNAVDVKVGAPVTFWCTLYAQNFAVNWMDIEAIGFFCTDLLKQPIAILGIGTVRVNLATIVHYDPKMSVRMIQKSGKTDTGMAWTRIPALPPSLIGYQIYYQVLIFNKTGPTQYALSGYAGFTIGPR